MAITLAEAKVGMRDKVSQSLIDEYRRESFLLDKLTFDDVISPGTGGSTLVYGFTQLLTPSGAGVRQINQEYVPNEAKRTEKTAKAVILGGSYEIDRVIAKTSGAVDEIKFQQEQKIKAGANLFHNLVINGNSASTGAGVLNTFDGLDKTLTGSDTEVSTSLDVSTSALLTTNQDQFSDELDAFEAVLSEKPDMIMGNSKSIGKIKALAKRLGYFSKTRDEFGRDVEEYDGVQLVDLGKYYDKSTGNAVDIIPTDATTGKTDIYAVKFGLDAFHGISPDGSSMFDQYLPDLNAPGAVKKGEIELIAGVVLKDSTKAAVLRGLKVS